MNTWYKPIICLILIILGLMEVYFSKRIFEFLIKLNYQLRGLKPQTQGDLFGRVGIIIQGAVFIYMGTLALVKYLRQF